jgi:phage-related protein
VGEAASTASKINNALIEGAETGLEALVDITKNVTNSTFRACETALNFAVETTQSIWDAIWDAFSNAGNIIENCAEEFVNAVVPEEE